MRSSEGHVALSLPFVSSRVFLPGLPPLPLLRPPSSSLPPARPPCPTAASAPLAPQALSSSSLALRRPLRLLSSARLWPPREPLFPFLSLSRVVGPAQPQVLLGLPRAAAGRPRSPPRRRRSSSLSVLGRRLGASIHRCRSPPRSRRSSSISVLGCHLSASIRPFSPPPPVRSLSLLHQRRRSLPLPPPPPSRAPSLVVALAPPLPFTPSPFSSSSLLTLRLPYHRSPSVVDLVPRLSSCRTRASPAPRSFRRASGRPSPPPHSFPSTSHLIPLRPQPICSHGSPPIAPILSSRSP